MLWLKSRINYGKYSSLNRRAYDLNAQPSDPAFQYFQTLNLKDHKAILISPSYVSAILDYIRHEVYAKGKFHSSFNDNTEYFKTFYQTINEELSGNVRDVVLTIIISDLLKNNEIIATELYDKYLVYCKSSKMILKTSERC